MDYKCNMCGNKNIDSWKYDITISIKHNNENLTSHNILICPICYALYESEMISEEFVINGLHDCLINNIKDTVTHALDRYNNSSI